VVVLAVAATKRKKAARHAAVASVGWMGIGEDVGSIFCKFCI
jgi:hypothetical protein